jgi:hypothetical protein
MIQKPAQKPGSQLKKAALKMRLRPANKNVSDYEKVMLALKRALKEIKAPVEKECWLLNLTRREATEVKLLQILIQLDRTGFRKFVRHLCRNCYPQKRVKLLTHARLILRRRNIQRRIMELSDHFDNNNEKRMSLANGIPCVLRRAKRGCWPNWNAEFNCGTTRVRLALCITQLAMLTYAVDGNINALKRMKPRKIECQSHGKWQTLPQHMYRAAITAIVEKTPLEVAALIS